MKFSTALVSITSVFVLNLICIVFKIYGQLESTDVVLHFLGGFTVAMLAAALIHQAKAANKPMWFNFLFALGFVILIGALWEGLEFFSEHFLSDKPFWAMLTLRDSLGDLLADGLGGILAWYLFIRKIN